MPVALVTGCSSGFGLVTALAFARAGHEVVAGVRRPSSAGELERAADAEGLRLDLVQLDVTDPRSVDAAVAAALGSHRRIDVLVNNAGIGARGAIEDSGDGDVRAVFETNVFGALRMLRAVLPAMRAQGSGVVVNVSSLSGRVAAPFGGIYSASKYALEAISESLHYELGPFGVRVVLIEPGSYPTAFGANRRTTIADEGGAYDDVQRRWFEAYGSLPGREGPPADPAEVADAIVAAAADPSTPLRRLVGADAELLGQLRRDLDDEAFERTIRDALGFWDGFRGERPTL